MTVRKVYNDTGYALDDLEKLPTIFTVDSRWRQRNVVVKKHPDKAGRLITIGYTWDNKEVLVADEPETVWAREMESLPWRQHFVHE